MRWTWTGSVHRGPIGYPKPSWSWIVPKRVPSVGQAALALGGTTASAVSVSAMLDEHARLRLLLEDAISATPALDEDYWVGMGIDAVAVLGESAEMVTAGIEVGGMAGCAGVLEFVRA